MKTLKQIMSWMRDAKGVATSLIEATATVAVGAVLAGVAVGGAIDAINDSKIQAAIGDVSSIGQGVITFYKDNSFFPLYKDGQKTGADDEFFEILVSENGTYPSENGDLHWSVDSGHDGTWADENSFGLFGHKPDFALHGTVEGHLIRNTLLSPGNGEGYPLRGSYAGDPQRGWAGPYVAVLPKTDPWGNKYMINVQELNAKHLLEAHSGLVAGPGALPKIAVVVLSAGPNRLIETSAAQQFDAFAAVGDDIVFRVK
jgi:hypothetical protein